MAAPLGNFSTDPGVISKQSYVNKAKVSFF